MAPPELEERYRRFLTGRGDVVDPLILYLKGDRRERADSRAWSALILSRIYLLKGRLGLALSYLHLSSSIFSSVKTKKCPLGIWVNRAIILKAEGRVAESENLLRRVYGLALRGEQTLAAAKAASNLSVLLSRGGSPDESSSFLAFAERCYRAFDRGDELGRIELTKALLESERGMYEEAADRISSFLMKQRGDSLERERVIGLLLLLELFVVMGDFARAGNVLAQVESMHVSLERYRPQKLRFLYMKHLLCRRSGRPDEADKALESAEFLRRNLGYGGIYLRVPAFSSRTYTVDDAGTISREHTEGGIGLIPRMHGAGDIGAASRTYSAGDTGMSHRDLSAEPKDVHGAPLTDCALEFSVSYDRSAFAGKGGKYADRHVRRIASRDSSVEFITCTPGVKILLEEARRVATLPLPVLLQGESGVGKDILGRLIHDWSGRGEKPYISINVAALPRDLFESALFGHLRGAFTGATSRRPGLLESAGDGTLFLDEIGELDRSLQVKLLRLLDTGEFITLGESKVKHSGARIITATNRDLTSAVSSGAFRGDLFYRLAVLTFRIPPLRERRQDIPALAGYFLEKACRLYDLGPMRVGEGALALLAEYDWPGNARELQNEIVRAAARKRKGTLRICHFSINLMATAGDGRDDPGGDLPSKIRELEKTEITRALRDAGGNCAGAAAMLGLKRTTLIYKMKRLGIL